MLDTQHYRMTQNITPSAGRKYDARISWVASENSLFPPPKMSIYNKLSTANYPSRKSYLPQ